MQALGSNYFVFAMCSAFAFMRDRDRASPVVEQLTSFHEHALIIILIVITTALYTIIRIIQNLKKKKQTFHPRRTIIETISTIAPAINLVFIAIPSLRLLYLID